MITNLQKFFQSLHGRGLNQTTLAQAATCGRAHLSEVLNNKPGHGHFTRPRLFPFLTVEEVRLLGWTEEYNRWRAKQAEPQRSTGNFVPKETGEVLHA